MSETKHWAYGAYENLNKLGVKINETRFDEPMTRGEVFAVLNNVLSIALKQDTTNPTPPPVKPVVPSKKIEFYESKAGTRLLKADVSQLDCTVFDYGQSNKKIPDDNCVNGTFFSWESTKKYFSTSPLIVNRKPYRYASNHNKPQSCFIVYNNNTVEMRKIQNINALDLTQIKFLFGGVGLINNSDSAFEYNPAAEGFSGAFSDVLRNTYKTVIGYKKSENKIYLLTRFIEHKSSGYDLIDVCNDYALDIALSLDGGGSTFLKHNGVYKVKGDGRRVHNIIKFNE